MEPRQLGGGLPERDERQWELLDALRPGTKRCFFKLRAMKPVPIFRLKAAAS